MNKKKIFLFVLMIVSLLILCGCGLSNEEKKVQKERKKEYTELATVLMKESLSEKYEIDDVKISSIKIEKSTINSVIGIDALWLYFERVYVPIATAKAKIGKEKFDVCIGWDSETQEIEWCYDSRESDKVIEDLDAYFLTLYGVEPYDKEYNVFEYNNTWRVMDKLLEEKYDGDIEKFLDNQTGTIILAYENLESIYNEEKIKDWQTGCRISILNSYDDSFDIKNIKFKVDEYNPGVKEFLKVENEQVDYWENDIQDFGKFLYQGSSTNKDDLVKNDRNLNLEMWRNVIEDMNEYEYTIVSDWYYVPEKRDTFFLKIDELDCFKYYTLYMLKYVKDSKGEYVYCFEEVKKDYDNFPEHIKIEESEGTYFAICTRKKNYTPEDFLEIIIDASLN